MTILGATMHTLFKNKKRRKKRIEFFKTFGFCITNYNHTFQGNKNKTINTHFCFTVLQ